MNLWWCHRQMERMSQAEGFRSTSDQTLTLSRCCCIKDHDSQLTLVNVNCSTEKNEKYGFTGNEVSSEHNSWPKHKRGTFPLTLSPVVLYFLAGED